MPSIKPEHIPLLLEAIEELLYKVSLRLEKLKGQPMSEERKELTEKQRKLEKLQHQLLEDASSGQVDQL